jgi:hypothetical protein
MRANISKNFSNNMNRISNLKCTTDSKMMLMFLSFIADQAFTVTISLLQYTYSNCFKPDQFTFRCKSSTNDKKRVKDLSSVPVPVPERESKFSTRNDWSDRITLVTFSTKKEPFFFNRPLLHTLHKFDSSSCTMSHPYATPQ